MAWIRFSSLLLFTQVALVLPVPAQSRIEELRELARLAKEASLQCAEGARTSSGGIPDRAIECGIQAVAPEADEATRRIIRNAVKFMLDPDPTRSSGHLNQMMAEAAAASGDAAGTAPRGGPATASIMDSLAPAWGSMVQSKDCAQAAAFNDRLVRTRAALVSGTQVPGTTANESLQALARYEEQMPKVKQAFHCTNFTPGQSRGATVSADGTNAALALGRRYKQMCDAGVPAGCDSLGLMYENRESQDHNYDRAAQLYRQACDGRDGDGCLNLGMLFENGWGRPPSLPQAAALYRSACDLGHQGGCEAQRRLAGRGFVLPPANPPSAQTPSPPAVRDTSARFQYRYYGGRTRTKAEFDTETGQRQSFWEKLSLNAEATYLREKDLWQLVVHSCRPKQGYSNCLNYHFFLQSHNGQFAGIRSGNADLRGTLLTLHPDGSLTGTLVHVFAYTRTVWENVEFFPDVTR